MSDFNESNRLKSSLPQKCLDLPGPLDTAKIHDKNDSVTDANFKYKTLDIYHRTHSNDSEESISPGTEVCVPAMSETICDAFNLYSDDELAVLDFSCSINAPDHQFSKNSVTGELEKSSFVYCAKKNSKSVFPSGGSTKSNLSYQSASSSSTPSSKLKNNSNFSIFGQLLNKKPNNPVSRGLGNSSKEVVSLNSRQSSPSHILKGDLSSDSNDGAQRAQMKTKLRSMWNNMKYGWRMKREVNLKTDSAIWLLGQCYHNKFNDGTALTQDAADQLRLDLLSKIWLTYRINFPALPGTNLVSDSGWGCMLRSGQMMMAQAFVCHFLQRDWRLSSDQSEEKSQMYKMILRWFGDSLSEKSPFSLHHLVSLGENYGRKAGDWYGPTHAAHVLRDALLEAKKQHPQLQQFCMYVASDGIVFKQDVMDLCMNSNSQEETNSLSSLGSDFASISLSEVQENSGKATVKTNFADLTNVNSSIYEETSEGAMNYENACPSYSAYGPPSYSTIKPKWKSLILFVSVRLGNDKINPFYIPCLKSLLAYENCIGIIGGRPKHALYFIGWQDDKIIHMDPHSCQPAVDVEKEDFNEKSFHSSAVRTMAFNEMDPSCAIGFYFREFEDFQIFIEKFSEITAPLKRNLEYPVFALADGKRIEIEDNLQLPDEKCIYSHMSSKSQVDDDEDDDYILL